MRNKPSGNNGDIIFLSIREINEMRKEEARMRREGNVRLAVIALGSAIALALATSCAPNMSGCGMRSYMASPGNYVVAGWTADGKEPHAQFFADEEAARAAAKTISKAMCGRAR